VCFGFICAEIEKVKSQIRRIQHTRLNRFIVDQILKLLMMDGKTFVEIAETLTSIGTI
ncbi:unnamed protein product, partial [Ceratitis capitata]